MREERSYERPPLRRSFPLFTQIMSHFHEAILKHFLGIIMSMIKLVHHFAHELRYFLIRKSHDERYNPAGDIIARRIKKDARAPAIDWEAKSGQHVSHEQDEILGQSSLFPGNILLKNNHIATWFFETSQSILKRFHFCQCQKEGEC